MDRALGIFGSQAVGSKLEAGWQVDVKLGQLGSAPVKAGPWASEQNEPWNRQTKTYSEYVKWYSSASWYFSLSLCERDVKDGCRGVMVVNAIHGWKHISSLSRWRASPHLFSECILSWKASQPCDRRVSKELGERGDLMNYGKHDLCLAIRLCHILLNYSLYFSMHSDQNLRCLRRVEFQDRSMRGSKHSQKLTEGASTAWKFWWSLLKSWDPAMQV